jgi:hypothetical protein
MTIVIHASIIIQIVILNLLRKLSPLVLADILVLKLDRISNNPFTTNKLNTKTGSIMPMYLSLIGINRSILALLLDFTFNPIIVIPKITQMNPINTSITRFGFSRVMARYIVANPTKQMTIPMMYKRIWTSIQSPIDSVRESDLCKIPVQNPFSFIRIML